MKGLLRCCRAVCRLPAPEGTAPRQDGRWLCPACLPPVMELVGGNWKLAFTIAKRYWKLWGRNLLAPLGTEEDARQEAIVALQRAAELFDPGRGRAFGTYLEHCVRHGLQKAACRCGPYAVPYAAARMVSPGLKAPASWRLSQATLRKAHAALRSRVSLPEDLDVPESRWVEPLAADERGELELAVRRLPARDRRWLRLVYGLGVPERKPIDVARSEGVSRQRIDQVIRRCLERLRADYRRREVG